MLFSQQPPRKSMTQIHGALSICSLSSHPATSQWKSNVLFCCTPYTNAFIAQHWPLKETMPRKYPLWDPESNVTTSIISSCSCQNLYCSLFFTIQSCERPVTNLIFQFQHSAGPLTALSQSNTCKYPQHAQLLLTVPHILGAVCKQNIHDAIKLAVRMEVQLLYVSLKSEKCCKFSGCMGAIKFRFIVKERACVSAQLKIRFSGISWLPLLL